MVTQRGLLTLPARKPRREVIDAEFEEVRKSLKLEASTPLIRVDPRRDGPVSPETLRSVR